MKISGRQIFWMMFTFEVGQSLLLVIPATIRTAKQDAWISILIAGDRGCSYFLATTLGSLYPKQTLIEFSQTILGKWLGKLLLIPYFFGWYMIIWITVREFGEFIIIALFHNTPLWVIVLTAMLLLILLFTKAGWRGWTFK